MSFERRTKRWKFIMKADNFKEEDNVLLLHVLRLSKWDDCGTDKLPLS